VPRPPKELRGFARISLQPGESRQVEIALRSSAFGYYDVATQQWKADAGECEIQIACSSRDIRLRAKITLAADRLIACF
jgi:beta-glucosidase